MIILTSQELAQYDQSMLKRRGDLFASSRDLCNERCFPSSQVVPSIEERVLQYLCMRARVDKRSNLLVIDHDFTKYHQQNVSACAYATKQIIPNIGYLAWPTFCKNLPNIPLEKQEINQSLFTPLKVDWTPHSLFHKQVKKRLQPFGVDFYVNEGERVSAYKLIIE